MAFALMILLISSLATVVSAILIIVNIIRRKFSISGTVFLCSLSLLIYSTYLLSSGNGPTISNLFIILAILAGIVWVKHNQTKNRTELERTITDRIEEEKLVNLPTLKSGTKNTFPWLILDEEKQEICTLQYLIQSKNLITKRISFKNIIKVEIIEDNEIVANNLTGAIAGDILLGPVGALIGSATSSNTRYVNMLELRITINDLATPLIKIPLINKQMNKKLKMYKQFAEQAAHWHALILVAMHQAEQ